MQNLKNHNTTSQSPAIHFASRKEQAGLGAMSFCDRAIHLKKKNYDILNSAKLEVLEHSKNLLSMTTGCQQHNMINITSNLQVTIT